MAVFRRGVMYVAVLHPIDKAPDATVTGFPQGRLETL